MHNDFDIAARPHARDSKRPLNAAVDALLSEINFESKAQAILPENVEITKRAFQNFFKKMDWPLTTWSFEGLLKEKTGEHEFRADGKTPNWYHEARQVLYRLAKVRGGLVKEKDLDPYGGLEVAIAADWHHDSWEDMGISALSIYAGFEKRIHDIWGTNGHNDAYYFMLRQKAAMAANNVDLMTRKTPRLDHDGQFVRKPSGKYIKDDRFGGDLNLYMDQVLLTPLTIDGKFNDGIEGMATRKNVPAFTDEINRNYNEERRKIYGRRAIGREAIKKFPFLEKSIHASDDMLGILLVCMETDVDYSKPENNPRFARRIDIDRYLPWGKKGWEALGRAWHPVTGFLEDKENEAAAEAKPHAALLLDNSLYPALLPHFQKPHNYLERRMTGMISLPQGATYAPNMV